MSSPPVSDASAPSPPEDAPHPLLQAAWNRQDAYSKNASRYQKRFVFLRSLLAVLSVLVVALSIAENWLTTNLPDFWPAVVDFSLLLLPVTITALLAFSVKFDRGHNWILLRGNAESLKMEIYYYRTQVGPYQTQRDAVLAKRIKLISERIKGSPVHQGALSPAEEDAASPQLRMGLVVRLVTNLYSGTVQLLKQLWQWLFQLQEERSATPRDDKFSDLNDPEQYIVYRLENQFNWYRRKAKELAHQQQLFQAGVYLFGAVGTLLAASENFKSWVAVTTALTGALTNYLEFKRVEASLVGYNQAADALYDIRAWWYSLAAAEQAQPGNFHKLVESCEETIRSEHSSWLQDMQDRLSQLYGGNEEDNNGSTPDSKNSALPASPLYPSGGHASPPMEVGSSTSSEASSEASSASQDQPSSPS